MSSNGYHHNIGANTWRSGGSKGAGPNRAGLERVVFGVSDRDELTRLAERLGKNGWSASVNEDAVVLGDPDGIEVHFALVPKAH